jgi:rhodanese-related sulfurtransferase
VYFFHPERPALYVHDEPLAAGEIHAQQVREMEKKTGVLWIDARVKSQYDLSHVPGAHRLTEAEWNDLAFQIVDVLSANTKPIVIYCDTAKCGQSQILADKLKQMGNPEVHILKGGWRQAQEWVK